MVIQPKEITIIFATNNGYKHFLTDSVKDKYGYYRDDIIYEIINKEN